MTLFPSSFRIPRIIAVTQERIALWKARTEMARKECCLPLSLRTHAGTLNFVRRQSLNGPCHARGKRRTEILDDFLVSRCQDVPSDFKLMQIVRRSLTRYSLRQDRSPHGVRFSTGPFRQNGYDKPCWSERSWNPRRRRKKLKQISGRRR